MVVPAGDHGDVLSDGRSIRGDDKCRGNLRAAHHRRVADSNPRPAQVDRGPRRETRSRQRHVHALSLGAAGRTDRAQRGRRGRGLFSAASGHNHGQ